MITKHDGITVSQFVKQLKDVIDHHPSFNNVTLIGELSNFKAHQSGHFYFTLKDEGSRINCVMFRSHSQKLLFKPKDGDKVIVTGSVEVYEAAGTIQLYANRMNLDGLGDLYIQFQALKETFQAKGYFDLSHKKQLKKYPKKIGVIVGPNSAAYHDISRTLNERWPMARVEYAFSAVQGKEAISSVVTNLKLLDDKNLDAILIARGGGSIEDLWAFNEEAVVRAVFDAQTPIVSAVGHESDVTLIDFVSDYRAATPTAGAVALTPNADEVRIDIRNLKNRMYTSVVSKLQSKKQIHALTISNSKLYDPVLFIERKQMKLDYYQGQILKHTQHFEKPRKDLERFEYTTQRIIEQRLSHYNRSLELSLNRYSSRMELHLKDGRNVLLRRQDFLFKMSQTLSRNANLKSEKIDGIVTNMTRLLGHAISLKKKESIDIMRRISTSNPMEKLASIYERGFAYISIKNEPVNTIDAVHEGDLIEMKFKDGSATAEIIRKDSKHGNI